MSSLKSTISFPDVITLAGSEAIDGRAYEAVCSLVYFSSAEQRERCQDAANHFETEHDGRTFYGTELVYYLD